VILFWLRTKQKSIRPVFLLSRRIPASPNSMLPLSRTVKILLACFAVDLLVSTCIFSTLGVRSTIDCLDSLPSSIVASYSDHPTTPQAAVVQLVKFCIGKESSTGGEN